MSATKGEEFAVKDLSECYANEESLVRCTIIEVPLCDHCCSTLENPLHALWSCHELDIVWSDSELWSFRSAIQFLDLKETLSWIIMQEKKSGSLRCYDVVDLDTHQAACTLHQVA